MRIANTSQKKQVSTLTQEGFLTAEWVVGLSLLLIPAFLIVFSVMQFPQRQNLTQVASAAAARAYVQALDERQAVTAAQVAAADAIAAEVEGAGQTGDRCDAAKILLIIQNSGGDCAGLKSGDIKVDATLVDSSLGYCPGSEVTVTVSVPVPVSINPFSGSSWNLGISALKSSSTERIDDYAELATSPDTGPPLGYDTDNDPCGP